MLLAEAPSNGYQLMQTIEERSGGRWRPSPGSVYPALSQLEDEGYVQTINQDSGRAFQITDAGRQHLAERGDDTPPWETGDNPRAQAFHDLRTKLFGLGKASIQVIQVGNEEQCARASEVLDEARRSLYRILADEHTGEDATDEPSEANEPAGDDE
jgi:DNA-binding PadR family transcriptional regulator